MGRIDGYRNFCNKLWNASRYVLMNTEEHDCVLGDTRDLSDIDRWIRSRAHHLIAAVRGHFDTYRLDLVAQAVYEFTWHEFCAWYLELSKTVLQNERATASAKAATRSTLVSVLEALLRVLHPLMPFITEEIWQRVAPLTGRQSATIMLAPFPEAGEFASDPEVEAELRWLMDFILGIRQIRGEMDIAPSRPLPVLLQNASASDLARLERHRNAINQIARAESVQVLDETEQPPQAATALLGEMKILVPMAGLIDTDAEAERLRRQIEKVRIELRRCEGKLANEAFVKNAPDTVVEQERQRLAEFKLAEERLREQLARILPDS